MSWVAPGLLYAFFNSVVIFVNEKFKRQPSFLGMYRGFGSMAVALPFVFWVPPPTDVWFWVFACLQGIMVGFFDYRLFASSARYGAGGTSMMTVLAIVLTIVLWWLIDLNRLLRSCTTHWCFWAFCFPLRGVWAAICAWPGAS